MITTSVLQRTFQLNHKGALGTCFTIDLDNRQYIVTARHCVDEFDPAQFQMFHNGQWKNVNVSLVGFGSHEADIAVLTTDIQLSPPFPLPASLGHAVFGQDAYFLGFPFGLRSAGGELNRGFPLPLVKRAIISAMPDFGVELQTVILDGHNNPGFSGGPVVFVPMGKSATDLRVGAVISAYRIQPEDILLKDQPTGLVYRANTGIIISHSIKHAVDAIKSNPVGFELPAAVGGT